MIKRPGFERNGLSTACDEMPFQLFFYIFQTERDVSEFQYNHVMMRGLRATDRLANVRSMHFKMCVLYIIQDSAATKPAATRIPKTKFKRNPKADRNEARSLTNILLNKPPSTSPQLALKQSYLRVTPYPCNTITWHSQAQDLGDKLRKSVSTTQCILEPLPKLTHFLYHHIRGTIDLSCGHLSAYSNFSACLPNQSVKKTNLISSCRHQNCFGHQLHS